MSLSENVVRGHLDPIPGVDMNTTIYEEILGWKKRDGRFLELDGDYIRTISRLPDYSGTDSDALKLSDICDVFAIDKHKNNIWYVELRIADSESRITHYKSGSLAWAITMAILRQDYTHPNYKQAGGNSNHDQPF